MKQVKWNDNSVRPADGQGIYIKFTDFGEAQNVYVWEGMYNAEHAKPDMVVLSRGGGVEWKYVDAWADEKEVNQLLIENTNSQKDHVLSVSCAELENGRFALLEKMYNLAKKANAENFVIGDGTNYALEMKIVKKETTE